SMKPLISIALPVYNGGSTLGLAVRSIIRQSFQSWELIILDDASTDDSVDVMRDFHDERIRLVEGEENIGLSARLNMAMDLAEGEYFARMDQDDVSFPQRLQKQFDYLQSHPDVDLLSSNVLVFAGDGKALGQWQMVNGKHETICRQPWRGFYMAHPTWMGKLQWFRRHRYRSSADGAEDQELLYRAYRESCFACLCEPLLAYRESRTAKKMFRARRIVLRALGREAYARGYYADLMKIVLIQVFKLCGDVLQHGLGMASLRNPLQPLDAVTQSLWIELWRDLKTASENTNKKPAIGR
ncbi:MAG: glycosyltransferase family 2 protein, partial [Mariprofundaceae bacterium]|nr:glycosyltransferase family 2 protein [Mariprofundaceae bacterium]